MEVSESEKDGGSNGRVDRINNSGLRVGILILIGK